MRRLVICLLMIWCPLVCRGQQRIFIPTCAGEDDTSRFTQILSAIGSREGTIRLPPEGARCAVNSLTIPPNVTLDNSEGIGIRINNGQSVVDAGPLINPAGRQLFFNALGGQGKVTLAASIVRPEWFGAGSGKDIRSAVEAALAALPADGGILDLRGLAGGLTASETIRLNRPNVQVLFGAGSIDLSGNPGLDIAASNVHVMGLGERTTNLRNMSSGATVQISMGVERSSISDLSIIVTTGSRTAQGLLVKGVASGLIPVTSNCYAHNIEINGNAVSGQIGLNLDGTGAGGSVITFNAFYNFKITGLDRPVVLESHTEANMLFGFNIDRYGSGNLGIGAVVNGHANQLTSFWFGRNASTAIELQGFSVSGNNNVLEGIIDAADGAPYIAFLFDLIGKGNKHSGTVVGSTTFYAKTLGNNPLPQYVPIVPTRSIPAATPRNEGTILIEDAGQGVRNLVIYSGGQRFRIPGVAF